MKLDEASLLILNHVFYSKIIELEGCSNIIQEKLVRILSATNWKLEDFLMTSDFTDNYKGQLVNLLVQNGVKIDSILEFLDWKGFETIISGVFDMMGFTVQQNFRFKDEFTKYEVDVLAFKYPFLYLIDCKHYKTPNKTVMKDAVNKQKERTEILLEEFPILYEEIVSKLQLPLKRKIFLYPVIISWKNHDIQIYQDIPIVAFSHLQGFIQEMNEIRFNLFHLTLELD